MVNICGVVVLLFTLCNLLSNFIQNKAMLWLLSAFCEVSTACAVTKPYFGTNIYLFCIALTVLPVSSYLQVKSVGNNCFINYKVLFISKTAQIPLSLLILRTLLNLFPQVQDIYANGDITVNTYWNSPKLSVCFLFVSLCFVFVTEKKLKVFTIKEK